MYVRKESARSRSEHKALFKRKSKVYIVEDIKYSSLVHVAYAYDMNLNVLYTRVHEIGISVEDAVFGDRWTPTHIRYNKTIYHSVDDLAKAVGRDRDLLQKRLDQGWMVYKAVNEPPACIVEGKEFCTKKDCATHYNINPNTFQTRINRGIPIVEAVFYRRPIRFADREYEDIQELCSRLEIPLEQLISDLVNTKLYLAVKRLLAIRYEREKGAAAEIRRIRNRRRWETRCLKQREKEKRLTAEALRNQQRPQVARVVFVLNQVLRSLPQPHPPVAHSVEEYPSQNNCVGASKPYTRLYFRMRELTYTYEEHERMDQAYNMAGYLFNKGWGTEKIFFCLLKGSELL